jgi:hypothetical protein
LQRFGGETSELSMLPNYLPALLVLGIVACCESRGPCLSLAYWPNIAYSTSIVVTYACMHAVLIADLQLSFLTTFLFFLLVIALLFCRILV